MLIPMGPVLVTDTSATGAITPDTATQPAAPASGHPAALIMLTAVAARPSIGRAAARRRRD